ncbi:DUF4229 domain-containing protein [Pseudoclavibacter helvolus]
MNSKRAWLVYTVIRLLAFAVPFAVVMLALPDWQWNWLAGAAVGAIISACISVIFLRGTRQQMGADLHVSVSARTRAPLTTRTKTRLSTRPRRSRRPKRKRPKRNRPKRNRPRSSRARRRRPTPTPTPTRPTLTPLRSRAPTERPPLRSVSARTR